VIYAGVEAEELILAFFAFTLHPSTFWEKYFS